MMSAQALLRHARHFFPFWTRDYSAEGSLKSRRKLFLVIKFHLKVLTGLTASWGLLWTGLLKPKFYLQGGWTFSGMKASKQRAESFTLVLCQQPEASNSGDVLLSFFGSWLLACGEGSNAAMFSDIFICVWFRSVLVLLENLPSF